MTELGHCAKGALKPPVRPPTTLVSSQNKRKACLLHLEFPLTAQCKHGEAQEKCQPALSKPARQAGDKKQTRGWGALAGRIEVGFRQDLMYKKEKVIICKASDQVCS